MSASQTPAQSHEEIQKLLRAEIDALKTMLDARFAEIAKLTEKLEQVDVSSSAQTEAALNAQKARHAVEIALIHALHASWQNGPAVGVPPFAEQIEILGGSDLFDPSWYLMTYPDVNESGMSPREHYVRAGAFEGRNPGPDFDTMSYYEANSDLASMGWPALVHYAAFGKAEGRPLS